MKIRRRKGRGRHAHYSGPEGSTVEELAAQLAPPEEQQQQAQSPAAGPGAARNGGAIIVDTGALKMPEGFATRKREARFEVARVVVFVTLLMLLFTAFVAWQIARTPDERDEPQPVKVVAPDE